MSNIGFSLSYLSFLVSLFSYFLQPLLAPHPHPCQEDIVGTAYLAAAYLEETGFDKSKLVYVVGSSGITQELDDVGIKYLPIGVRDGVINLGIKNNHDHKDTQAQ